MKLYPSNSLLALVMAYDTTTPPAHTKEEFRAQSQLFLESVQPVAEAVRPLLDNYTPRSGTLQNCFDALLSIGLDAGSGLLLGSNLAKALMDNASRQDISKAMLSIPIFNETLRPQLAECLVRYKMPSMTRRHFERELFNGNTYFTIGRTAIDGEIVWAPTLLHPVYRFLFAVVNREQ